MTLRLTLENFDRLPDGGPVSVQVKERGLEIGRDSYLDWTLPDPERIVSGKHCQIRFRDGGYWLHDLSRNGTYLNGSNDRLEAPHNLRTGDKIGIGPYIVAVEIQGASGAALLAPAGDDFIDDPWSGYQEIGPPDDSARYRPAAVDRFQTDWIDAAASIPAPVIPAPALGDEDWLRPAAPGPSLAAAVAAPRPPSPRRPPSKPEPEAPPSFEAGPGPNVLRLIADAAGLPSNAFDARGPEQAAAEIGALLRTTAERLGGLLHARDETRGLMRSASGGLPRRQAAFNPLEFHADAREALGIMFGPRNPRYLDAAAAVDRAFADAEKHQVQVFDAMRATLESLFAELAPERIEASIANDRGLSALLTSRKAQLWDIYAERWRALSRRSDGRLSEAFWALIGEAYDRSNERGG